MIHLKNKSEIEKLYHAGQIVKETLFLVEENIKPGVTTLQLDKIAEECNLTRVKAGIHYPSDGEFSKRLVDIFNN